jgi:hypothetical protein
MVNYCFSVYKLWGFLWWSNIINKYALFIHVLTSLLIHLFSNYLVSTSCIIGTVLSTGEGCNDEQDREPATEMNPVRDVDKDMIVVQWDVAYQKGKHWCLAKAAKSLWGESVIGKCLKQIFGCCKWKLQQCGCHSVTGINNFSWISVEHSVPEGYLAP